MNAPAFVFFEGLFTDSRTLISRLPITVEPASISYVVDVLEVAVEEEQGGSLFANPSGSEWWAAVLSDDRRTEEGYVAGMNTVGMLLDRLSILAMKHWNLVNRANAPGKARELVESQVAELLTALSMAKRGHSSVNNKLSNRLTRSTATDFASACFGLCSTNILLWEAQEVLYNRDIETLPCEELRAYIKFFSRRNLARNAYIEAVDGFYWNDVEEALS